MSKVVAFISNSNKIILAVLGIAMTVLLTLDGLGRYLFSMPISWASEFVRIGFVWGCFISITVGFMHNSHIGFDSIAKMNKWTKKTALLVNGICLTVIGFVVMYYGASFVKTNGEYPLPAINLPIGILYSSGVVCGTIWIFIGLWQLISIFRKSKNTEKIMNELSDSSKDGGDFE